MGKIRTFQTLDSTNRYASSHFDELEDGELIVAETQTAGRGRLSRLWNSPPGNFYGSFVIKEPFEEPFYATMVSSLSVIAAVRELIPQIPAKIKWPNDVMIGARKLCGVLCEGVIREGKLRGIICGIGVNVNLPEEELKKISQPATSLFFETGEKINLEKFTEQLAIYLNWYYITGIHSAESLYQSWKKASGVIGETVTLVPPDGMPFQAQVLDLTRDGRLEVKTGTGETICFSCGDVKLKAKSQTT